MGNARLGYIDDVGHVILNVLISSSEPPNRGILAPCLSVSTSMEENKVLL